MSWFARRPPPKPAAPASNRRTRPVTAEEVALAYRIVLGRDVDDEGLRGYVALGRSSGFSLSDLIDALRESDEYKAIGSETAPRAVSAAADTDADLIRPADVIARLSLDDLIGTADEYYRRIPDATPLMAKPFAYWHEAPQMLQDLGALLSGLRIGKSMTVLDFGGGTGWLSRILTELGCQAICCDVSEHALDIGRRSVDRHPLVGAVPYRPIFLRFDGTRLDLADDSVDRIVCFDAFHHVPNPATVVAELARVLRPGGVAGFSEPGRWHSRSAQSQYEMRHHKVLENDVDLNAIAAVARAAGFTRLTLKALVDAPLSLAEYNVLLDDAPAHDRDGLRTRLWDDMRGTMANRSVFFLHKGEPVFDSRGHEGLAHRLRIVEAPASAAVGRPFLVSIDATNTGRAIWLHQNVEIFGIVRLGTHLCDARGTLLSLDFSRHGLAHDVRPGDTIRIDATLTIPDPGEYRLQFDLVAEGVMWFENAGSCAVEAVIVVV